MEGALPRSRGARGLPNLPRFACADLRCAPPSALLRVGDTPPHCALLPPPSPGGVRHVGTCRVRHEEQKQPQRRDTMSSAATTQGTSAIDSKKPNTKQELIAANIKLLIEQLEAGHSEALTNYLTAMSRFHNYSFGNILEIARQMPTATRGAGVWTWKNLGRSVNAGAKGIRILAPIVGVKRKPDAEAEKDITKQNTRAILGFRNAYVFDISQTNGIDLPALHEVSGDPGENIDRLAAFLKAQGIALVYNPKIAPALGM